ncbi:MAG: outer membrane beta-barrel protein [Flavipsychrobacter sp.]
MNTKLLLLLSLFLLSVYTSFAQTHSVSGTIIDANDGSTLIGVNAVLIPILDTNNKLGTVTDADGNFRIDNVAAGRYTFKTLYVGYKTTIQTVTVTDNDVSLGTMKMSVGGNELKTVTVTGKQIRAEQMGDTTSFRADAYKTNPDATAEDLVTKMPGVTSDNSGVKVNGEDIKQVYVDGKPFFGGDDPTLALKNLPAEVIDKVQFFDKASDQSQFTGFDDGQSQKTMNIITKRNKSEGQFGKIYGGIGTDGTNTRYSAGGNLNIFNGDRRISIIELSNNVNQQNFSSQDILGVSGGGGGRGGMGGGRGFGGGGTGGGGAASNFLVGQQGGITTTHSVGLNYSDNWGKKIKVMGSYFFNSTDNINNTQLTRDYFTTDNTQPHLVYNENNHAETKNLNHRFAFRFEYAIDSNNALIITPKVSVQQNNATTGLTGINTVSGIQTGYTQSNTMANNNGYSFSNNLLFQHKFHKKGRTVSLNVYTAQNEKTGDGSYTSFSEVDTGNTSLDQHYTLYNNGFTVSPSVNYTEPIGKHSQLMASYNPSYTKGLADKESSDVDPTTGEIIKLDSLLSNRYTNTYFTQRGGLNYRLSNKQYNFMAGANVQYATLNGDQTYPYPFTLSRTFTNVLPIAMFNYRFNSGKNLRIMYRTNTTAPGITQLQNVLDISNPLLLRTGNPLLKQDYEHTLIMRYGLTKAQRAHSFFVFLYANAIQNYISNATIIPDSTTTVNVSGTSYKISKGSQLSYPVNLNGYWNTRAFATYGLPLDIIKSNLNFNGGFSFMRQPALVNNILNYSNNYVPGAGVVLSSNVSEDLDFTLSYSANYNVVRNTIQTQADQDYFSHIASFKINYIFLNNFVINTNITNTYFTGLANTPAENYFLWNAYVAYKFLKNRSLEARLSVFDILDQNKSISRTVTETYLENSTTQVLQQYFMFTLTYTLRNFKGTMPQQENRFEAPPGAPMMHNRPHPDDSNH